MNPEEREAQLARYAEGKKKYHERRERRRRIKAQNAERKAPPEPPKPLTPEQRRACTLIAQGLIELFFSFQPERDEFPSELDTEEVKQ